MAKQPKTETNTPKVPEAELVGDHANAANGGKNAGADSGAASVPATATGEATAPVATSSTDTTASGSGDAAGTVTTGLVKPQEAIQPTTAIPAGADQGTSSPEVEASTSGTSSTDTPERNCRRRWRYGQRRRGRDFVSGGRCDHQQGSRRRAT
ncbi:hypothetical protein [Brucella inopinata]|uniref:hypothetical protein n=1 Tax=Brucella inopinata TaxID=1218315 RepID=UPI000870CD14|nr:hypothetical protein [Brucella inopinata]SCD23656.1 hypothetical protein BR141012304_11237 [Brucella inopinata]